MTTWYVALESTEWVGPITVTITVSGTPVTVDPSAISFAVLPLGTRPVEADWADPVPEPGATGRIGIQAGPVDSYQHLGIWVRFVDAPNIPVLTPDEVGLLVRS